MRARGCHFLSVEFGNENDVMSVDLRSRRGRWSMYKCVFVVSEIAIRLQYHTPIRAVFNFFKFVAQIEIHTSIYSLDTLSIVYICSFPPTQGGDCVFFYLP